MRVWNKNKNLEILKILEKFCACEELYHSSPRGSKSGRKSPSRRLKNISNILPIVYRSSSFRSFKDVCMVDSRLRDLAFMVLKRSVPIITGLGACLDNSTLCLDYAEFQGNTSFSFFLIYSFY